MNEDLTGAEKHTQASRLWLPVVIMGATALIVQVVLTRELLSTFFGNELSIGLVLAAWLMTVAAGSALGASRSGRFRKPADAFGWCQMLFAPVALLALLVARCVQPFGVLPGDSPPPGAMLVLSLVALSPVCFVVGLKFVLAAGAFSRGSDGGSKRGGILAKVYALEAAGAVLGGVTFHFILSDGVGPLQTLAIIGVLNVASGVFLVRRTVAFGLALVLFAGLVTTITGGRELELTAMRASPRWEGVELVDLRVSRYGTLVVARRAGQLGFYQSGVLAFTSEDEQRNETLAHLTALHHPRPQRSLVIGGASSGLPEEISRHALAVKAVDLDPEMYGLARRWLGDRPGHSGNMGVSTAREDSHVGSVEVHHGDGRLYVRKTKKEFDLIVLNVPDPTTAALNRFYTVEMFDEASRALGEGGILAVTLTGSEHHISGSVLEAAASLYQTLSLSFEHVRVIPGDEMIFMASDEGGVLESDWTLLVERLEERGIESHFIDKARIEDLMHPFRGEMIVNAIKGERHASLNTDLNPVSYHHQTRIWLDRLSPGTSRSTGKAGAALYWLVIAGFLTLPALVLLARMISKRRTWRADLGVLLAVAALGSFGLILELLSVLVFQAACGYVYHSLGALMAAFMTGLGLGAAFARTRAGAAWRHWLLVGLLIAAMISLLLPGVFAVVVSYPSLALPILVLLLLVAGCLVGAVFPAAVELYGRDECSPAAAGGSVYAADLAGSAGAAVAAGTIVVPLLGVAGTARLTVIVTTLALIALLMLWRRG